VTEKCAAADSGLAAQWRDHVKSITTHYTPNDISISRKWHFSLGTTEEDSGIKGRRVLGRKRYKVRVMVLPGASKCLW